MLKPECSPPHVSSASSAFIRAERVLPRQTPAAIRTAFEQDGELSAGVELRRLVPGITDGVRARGIARLEQFASIANHRAFPTRA